MALIVTNFCKSGLGDRLLDIFVLSIYAKLEKRDLIIKWEDFNDNDELKPKWRYEDTKLENIVQFFKLPGFIKLQYNDPIINSADIQFDKYLGGEYSPYKFYNCFLKDKFSINLFEETLHNIKNEYDINQKLNFSNELLCTVHLRRTDKLRGNHFASISESDLEELDYNTIKAIIKAKELGFKYFYLSSDCLETKNRYSKILADLSLEQINPKNNNNIIESYFDYMIMNSSSLLIVSMKYSTFSLSNALLFNKIIWTTIGTTVYNLFGFNEHVNITNYDMTYNSLNI